MVPKASGLLDGRRQCQPRARGPRESHPRQTRVACFGALGNKVTQYESNKEIAPGITSVFTPGHTLGHTSHISHRAPTASWSRLTLPPAWAWCVCAQSRGHVAADMDGPLAEQSRRKLYDMLAADKMVVQGYHFPFPAVGYMEKDGSGYRVTPVFWNTGL